MQGDQAKRLYGVGHWPYMGSINTPETVLQGAFTRGLSNITTGTTGTGVIQSPASLVFDSDLVLKSGPQFSPETISSTYWLLVYK